jgi:hypothetical protein
MREERLRNRQFYFKTAETCSDGLNDLNGLNCLNVFILQR